MKNRSLLVDYIKVANIHATRLTTALTQARGMASLLNPKDLPQLAEAQLAFLDMLTLRFSKLQNVIGSKIFPITLDILGEEAVTFIDKLNRLERIGYLYESFDANWWMSLRDIRNQLNHDYPDDYDLISAHLATLISKAGELLQFWEAFKKKIETI